MDGWGARHSSTDTRGASLLSLGAVHIEPQHRMMLRKRVAKRVSRARGMLKTVLPLMRKPKDNQQTEVPPVVKVRTPAP